jgi:hypothetical protein
MKEIPLTQGKVSLVDDADYESLMQQGPWYAARCGNLFYATHSFKEGDTMRIKRMHRVILGLTDSLIHADHKDGNGLNNQRENLRIATRSNNSCNRNVMKTSQTGVRGVTYDWRPKLKHWQAYIWINKKRTYLGNFANIADAKAARLKAEVALHGEFSATISRKEG